MSARCLCFGLAILIGISIHADEKKKNTNQLVQMNYTWSNSSNKTITLYVESSKKKGDKETVQNLGSLDAYAGSRGRTGIYYHTNTTAFHATFSVKVGGQVVATKGFNFNGLASNLQTGNAINPAAEHLDVYVYQNEDGTWIAVWSVVHGV